jgi:hypothetical protein
VASPELTKGTRVVGTRAREAANAPPRRARRIGISTPVSALCSKSEAEVNRKAAGEGSAIVERFRNAALVPTPVRRVTP